MAHTHYPQAGLIDEMLEDTFEGLEDDDLEELADKEVEKVLFEVTNGERRGRRGRKTAGEEVDRRRGWVEKDRESRGGLKMAEEGGSEVGGHFVST